MSSLSGDTIERVIKQFASPETRKAFLGVFPIDSLPTSIPHYPMFMVINTHSHNLPGEHWLTIYISEDKIGEVFDPLGRAVSNFLIRWLNQHTKRWTTSRRLYQHPLSDKCGGYAVYYILHRLQRKDIPLTKSPIANDVLVSTFYNTLIGK